VTDNEFDEARPGIDPAAIELALREVEAELAQRWPENRVAPDLAREQALMDLLGSPQLAVPVIHVAGTNGKSSTARMIEALLRSFGLSTGLYVSPHLSSIRERICLNGDPVSAERFVRTFQDIAPYVSLVDAQTPAAPMTAFEVMTGVAFACFADAPVDVMIIECGMGGRWDATNVVDPVVTVITPVDLDHQDYLGAGLAQIAAEKAGIIKAGAPVIMGRQAAEVDDVVQAAATAVGVTVLRQGVDFAVEARALAVGGQLLRLAGCAGEYEDIYLPLHGAHQGDNAVTALAAVESFFGGGRRLNVETLALGFAAATSPGRLEVLRTGPTVVVDAAHNPAGARVLAASIREAFDFSHVIAVVAVLADKDAVGIVTELATVADEVVVARNSSPRSMDVDALAATVVRVLGGADRVQVADDLADAMEVATERADEWLAEGSVGIVVTGSVVTAGDVRSMLVGDLVPTLQQEAAAARAAETAPEPERDAVAAAEALLVESMAEPIEWDPTREDHS
jgi:dihydrofolate synthase/folylpolyglutamate synthase